jgi:tRNA-2-methylthio-N6-dimethylallyladenosine synthase
MMKYNNICKYIHLPVQSGSTRVLQLMNRTYTREWYLAKVARIKELMPDCSISADIIAGFCTETEEDHNDTMSIMQIAQYDYAYMYFYSERPGTLAEKRYEDDVPLDIKKRRLQEIVDVQWHLSNDSNKKEVGKIYEVLIEGNSKKSDQEWMGRTSQNKVVVFPKSSERASKPLVKGDYVNILITAYTKGTLIGTIK